MKRQYRFKINDIFALQKLVCIKVINVKTFIKGGVHPEENKFAHNAPIETFPLPKQAGLYVTQHLGAPSVVVVSKGDFLKTGQLIAKGESFISANLHSPFTGTVVKVEPVPDIIGYKKMAVVIDVEEDQWMDDIDTSTEIKREITFSRQEIIDRDIRFTFGSIDDTVFDLFSFGDHKFDMSRETSAT